MKQDWRDMKKTVKTIMTLLIAASLALSPCAGVPARALDAPAGLEAAQTPPPAGQPADGETPVLSEPTPMAAPVADTAPTEPVTAPGATSAPEPTPVTEAIETTEPPAPAAPEPTTEAETPAPAAPEPTLETETPAPVTPGPTLEAETPAPTPDTTEIPAAETAETPAPETPGPVPEAEAAPSEAPAPTPGPTTDAATPEPDVAPLSDGDLPAADEAQDGQTEDADGAPGDDLTEDILPPAEIVIEIAPEDLVFDYTEEDLADPDLILRRYVDLALESLLRSEQLPRALRISMEGRLNEVSTRLYERLKEQIGAIAAGDRTSTAISVSYEDLGIPNTFTDSSLGVASYDSSAAVEKIKGIYGALDFNTVRLALLVNCPYDLYWFDKTSAGISVSGYRLTGRNTGTEYSYTVTPVDYTVKLPVSRDYLADPDDIYQVDPAPGQSVSRAVANARAIVDKYADLNDLEKLNAYRDEISRLVDYNYNATDGSVPYGDPWQVIYVFDGDADTKVVCEGYAKAFQYLCDLTDFDGDVSCYTVTGRMGGDIHMWNIVHMSDDENYLADLTLSDNDRQDGRVSVGHDGSLFLTGYRDNADKDTYTFSTAFAGTAVTYHYDRNLRDLFTDRELTLSGERFIVHDHLTLYPRHTIVYRAEKAPGCETPGMAAHWQCRDDGALFADARGAGSVTADALKLPATGHRWGAWITEAEPTCTQDGLKARTCKNDPAHRETEVLPATGHDLTFVPGKQATFEREGRRASFYCAVCGAYFLEEDAAQPVTAADLVIPRRQADVVANDRGSGAEGGYRILYLDALLSDELTLMVEALPDDERLFAGLSAVFPEEDWTCYGLSAEALEVIGRIADYVKCLSDEERARRNDLLERHFAPKAGSEVSKPGAAQTVALYLLYPNNARPTIREVILAKASGKWTIPGA